MPRPNIVLLHSHNTGRHIQPYGFAMPTPNLQRLAEEGTLFRQAYTAAPTCSPSRACMMTGQWPHTNGMLGLAHRGFTLKDYDKTLIQHFNRAGYHTVQAGLQHIAHSDFANVEDLGYQRIMAPSGRAFGRKVTPPVVDFLSQSPDQPFLLDVGLCETHIPFPEPTAEDDPRYVNPPAPLPDSPRTRRDTAGLRASARDMDNAFGTILDALDRHGLRDNTLVLCFTDHGLQLPLNMCNLTDYGIETFMIMRGPTQHGPGFTGGGVCEQLISHIDLLPTLCDAAGIDPPDWVQGRSFAPDADGTVPRINDRIFAEVNFHAAYEPQRCVRDSRWKYIRRFDDRDSVVKPNADETLSRAHLLEAGWEAQPRWAEALFDLTFDPYEQHNLADDPRVREQCETMRGQLDEWMRQTDDPLLQGPLTPPRGSLVNDADDYSPKNEPVLYDDGPSDA